MFASGLSVKYGASMLVAKQGNAADQGDGTDVSSETELKGRPELASDITVGMRFPSYKVLNQSDARPWEFQGRLRSDGRFRIIVFAGNVVDPQQAARLRLFCKQLSASSFLVPHLNTNVQVLTLHSARRVDVELLQDFPDVLHPFDAKTGWDYDSVYVDDVSYHEGYGDAYKGYGVDRETGCVVVTRPDQYVGYVDSLDAEGFTGVETYFKGIFVA